MEPATRIVRLLGGNTAVAKILGISPQTVAHWKQPRDPHNGGDGAIPGKHALRLLDHAQRHGIALTLQDFLSHQSEAA